MIPTVVRNVPESSNDATIVYEVSAGELVIVECMSGSPKMHEVFLHFVYDSRRLVCNSLATCWDCGVVFVVACGKVGRGRASGEVSGLVIVRHEASAKSAVKSIACSTTTISRHQPVASVFYNTYHLPTKPSLCRAVTPNAN